MWVNAVVGLRECGSTRMWINSVCSVLVSTGWMWSWSRWEREMVGAR